MAPKRHQEFSGHGILGKGHNWLISPFFASLVQQRRQLCNDTSVTGGWKFGFQCSMGRYIWYYDMGIKVFGSLWLQNRQKRAIGKERDGTPRPAEFFVSWVGFAARCLRKVPTQGAYGARSNMDSGRLPLRSTQFSIHCGNLIILFFSSSLLLLYL